MTVSIVVPCYNQGVYLDECILSILSQTRTVRQVVIVDDASTDESWRAACRLARGPVIAVRAKENGGTAAALNLGCSLVSSEYVAIVHADDLIEPWHVEELHGAAWSRPRHFVYGDLRPYVNGERIVPIVAGDWDYERAKTRNLAHGAILMPIAAWREVGGYPDMPDGREDWAMTLRLHHGGWPGYHLAQERPSYLYRQHGDNRSLHNHTPERTAYFRERLQRVLPEVFGGS